MPLRPHLLLCLLAACAGARPEASTDRAPAESSVAPGPRSGAGSPGLTPGVCGPRETADSASRAACRRRWTAHDTRVVDLTEASDCAYAETQADDSVRACLARMDSSARQCPVAHAWTVHQADGVARAVEWRRCGSQGGAFMGDSIAWPLHYLLLHGDSTPGSPAIFSFSNTVEPAISGLDTVVVIDLDGDGAQELFIVNQVYGTGAIYEECALAVSGGVLRCWDSPAFPEPAALLRPGEELRKGWIRFPGPPGTRWADAGPAFATGKSLWYFTRPEHPGDPNCCPSTNASLWVEAVPRAGRFDIGLVLRATENQNDSIVRVDTLRP